jgi:hypothetical protein
LVAKSLFWISSLESDIMRSVCAKFFTVFTESVRTLRWRPISR